MDEKEVTNFFAMIAPEIEESVVTDDLPKYVKRQVYSTKIRGEDILRL